MGIELEELRDRLVDFVENEDTTLYRVALDTGIRYATIHGFYYGESGLGGKSALALQAYLMEQGA